MNTEFIARLHRTFDSAATANFNGVGGSARKEREADVFALCALLPKSYVEGRTVAELTEDSELPAEKVAERIELMKQYRF